HQSSWMGMLPMKGSDDSLSFFHSSASANQYSISLFATAARSRHMPSCAAKLFVALTLPAERGSWLDNINQRSRLGYPQPYSFSCDRVTTYLARNYLGLLA